MSSNIHFLSILQILAGFLLPTYTLILFFTFGYVYNALLKTSRDREFEIIGPLMKQQQ